TRRADLQVVDTAHSLAIPQLVGSMPWSAIRRAKRLQVQHWAFPFAQAPIERGRTHEFLRVVGQMSEQRVSARVVKFAEDVVNQEQRPGSGFLCENARLRQL